MKKVIWILLGAALCLCAAGCSQPAPERAADGQSWSDGWITVGGIVGVDTPEGIDPRENNDALSARGMYYAAWSIGQAEDFVNEDGDSAQLYDAQIYLLLAGFSAAEKVEENAAEWEAMANDRYAVEQVLSKTCNGQAFTVLTYAYDSGSNPYERGASAFGVYGNYAISVELSCREGFAGDPLEVLTDFLDHCHYSA